MNLRSGILLAKRGLSRSWSGFVAGILKKRCQMMDLEIDNCSEMERDFLVRYSNAAKSKSCVIVSLEDAEVRAFPSPKNPLKPP